MFKKLVILLSSILLCLCVVGCSSSSSTEKNSTKVDTDLPKKEIVKKSDKIVLDDTFLKSMKDYTSKFTYVNMNQKMTSYSLLNNKRGSEKVVADVDIELDLKNQINLTEMKANFTDNSDNSYSFADDNKNNVHLSKVNDSEYIAGDSSGLNMTIDYSKVINAYDFIKFISDGQFPKKGTKGKLEDGIYTFKTERKAKKEDLSGTKYDRLGKTTVCLTVKDDENNNLEPKSIEMETTFYVGQIKYGVSTVCEFSDYSLEELSMPEYVQASE